MRHIGIYGFYFLAILILLLKFLPITGQVHGNNYMPLFEACFIFYFYFFLEDNNPSLLFLFLMGFIFDTIGILLIGTSSLIFFLSIFLFHLQRKLFWYNSFNEIWLGFAIFLIQYSLIHSFIIFMSHDFSFDLRYLVIVNILTIIIYPIAHNIFNNLHSLIREEKNAK